MSPTLFLTTLLLISADPAETKLRQGAILVAVAGDDTRISARDVQRWVADGAAGLVGFRLINEDEAFVTARESVLDELRDCGSRKNCVISRLCRLDVSWGLLVGVNVLVTPPFVAVQLVDCDAGSFSGEVLGPLEEGTDLTTGVRARTREFLAAHGFVPVAEVTITSQPAAQIAVDGEWLNGSRAQLRPGQHLVRASLDGHKSVEVTVQLASGINAPIALILEPEPSVIESPWFWGGVAALVVAGAVATVSVLALSAGPDVCVRGPGADCR